MGQKTGLTQALNTRLARVRLFLCDVDGVLTDGSVFIGQERETKRFHIRDGLGLVLLRREGIKVGWISNRPSSETTLQAEELKIDFLEQAKGDKVKAAENILAKTGLGWEEVCYVGDDIVDLGVLKRAGVAVTVADAVPEAKTIAHYQTKAAGGHGAVREVVEMILKAQKKWGRLVAEHSA
jgi:3-deoxy-D-manno-octulosonate 8-phosphate phosphatase (KDO 8-P phosphatase)